MQEQNLEAANHQAGGVEPVFNPPLAQWQTEVLDSSAWIDSPPQAAEVIQKAASTLQFQA